MKPSIDNERLRKAREIAQNPANYQVCEGCDSIVGTAVITCPNCHAYRFDPDPSRVSEQAMLLGKREQTSVTSADMA